MCFENFPHKYKKRWQSARKLLVIFDSSLCCFWSISQYIKHAFLGEKTCCSIYCYYCNDSPSDDVDENFYNPARLGVLHNHVTKIIILMKNEEWGMKNFHTNMTARHNSSFFIYSYLIASIGSRSAAFLAGYQPKNTPVTVQTAKERNTLHAWM